MAVGSIWTLWPWPYERDPTTGLVRATPTMIGLVIVIGIVALPVRMIMVITIKNLVRVKNNHININNSNSKK